MTLRDGQGRWKIRQGLGLRQPFESSGAMAARVGEMTSENPCTHAHLNTLQGELTQFMVQKPIRLNPKPREHSGCGR
jgi:hypothetical protein